MPVTTPSSVTKSTLGDYQHRLDCLAKLSTQLETAGAQLTSERMTLDQVFNDVYSEQSKRLYEVCSNVYTETNESCGLLEAEIALVKQDLKLLEEGLPVSDTTRKCLSQGFHASSLALTSLQTHFADRVSVTLTGSPRPTSLSDFARPCTCSDCSELRTVLNIEAVPPPVNPAAAQPEQTVEDLTRMVASLQIELHSANTEKETLEAALEESRKETSVLFDKSATRDCIQMHPNARIGATGLYYCGQRLKGENLLCEQSNGSNCRECQRLDIQARSLPPGFLVNGLGRICRRGANGRDWYCGAAVLQPGSGGDGHCGPTNGPNCAACQEMATLSGFRYRGLLRPA